MRALADLVLLIHLFWILGVVLPIPLIWIGGMRRWRWVRHFGFRITHLSMIGVVVLESLLGLVCPLTLWEDVLRGRSLFARESFLQYWISKIVFYDFPIWVFTIVYLCVGAVVLIELWWIPPIRKPKSGMSHLF